ncbi:MADS-box transcription factor family protein [Striga asiatica]|uniref:MADS-box transcription factor family protein n=1 Tax=Striga asiatica TaxID=4170 RepID=A0A5A7Q3N5_STRAF|nr:MADS-box transcription factor family protein [Striga asiatica]
MAGTGSGRQTRGRQRIPMRLIENQDDLYATFSKRRRGLFKKACELSTLCGVDLGIIIFSPTNNPFSLWHPSMDSVIARYRNPLQNNAVRDSDNIMHERIGVLNRQLDEVLGQKDDINEAEKRQNEMNQTREKVWWEQVEVERVQTDEKKWLKDMISKIKIRINELENGGSGSTPTGPSPFPPFITQFNYYPPNINMSIGGHHPFASLFSHFPPQTNQGSSSHFQNYPHLNVPHPANLFSFPFTYFPVQGQGPSATTIQASSRVAGEPSTGRAESGAPDVGNNNPN